MPESSVFIRRTSESRATIGKSVSLSVRSPRHLTSAKTHSLKIPSCVLSDIFIRADFISGDTASVSVKKSSNTAHNGGLIYLRFSLTDEIISSLRKYELVTAESVVSISSASCFS